MSESPRFPPDARRRRVRLTPAGRAALAAGDHVKARLDADDAARLGAAALAALRRSLAALADEA